MAYEEIKFGGNAHNWKKGDLVEGKLESVREEIGPNKSTIYVIDGEQYWGTNTLDVLMEQVEVNKKVKIACVDDNHKFPNGRVGRLFKVEVER